MIWVLADSALEHFSHGWQDLVRRGVVEVTDSDAFPPQVSDVVGTAGYHFAVVAQYLKTMLDESRDDKSEGRLTVSHWICRWCGHVWADINLPVANAEMLIPPGVPCPDCNNWQLEPYIFEVAAHPAGDRLTIAQRKNKMAQLYGKNNPHPRGLIGEIIANQLLQAGWTQKEMPGYADWWVSPEGEDIGPLDWAKQHYDERHKIDNNP